MFCDQNRRELEDDGYTVVPGVLSEAECNAYIEEYKTWLKQFQKHGKWPRSKSSLIHSYNTGNLDVTWKIRLKAKRVFTQVWGTEKLLSSIDAIAIGRPPEDGEEEFATDGYHWLHTDQSAARKGFHAYQGAVYLEAAETDDWTFHLMKGSHKYAQEFYDCHPRLAFKSSINEFLHLRDEDFDWFTQKGCEVVRLPVPKGGIVLWDSRLIHANARPLKGRQNSGRWRYTTFVSMTPAIWTTDEDKEAKEFAYKNAYMTSHWASQGVRMSMSTASLVDTDIVYPKEVPPTGKTEEARQLWGVLPYDFNDGTSNGPDFVPTLDPQYAQVMPVKQTPHRNKQKLYFLMGTGLVALFAVLIAKKWAWR